MDTADILSTACILRCSDAADYRIRVDGREYLFEFSAMFGPLFIGKRGHEINQSSVPLGAFEAVTQWHGQGKRIGESGFCVWRPPDKDITQHLGGRHYMVIGTEQQEDRE